MRLHDALDYHARERGRADFAVQDGRRLTYGEAGALADRIAAALVTSGLTVRSTWGVLSHAVAPYETFRGSSRRFSHPANPAGSPEVKWLADNPGLVHIIERATGSPSRPTRVRVLATLRVLDRQRVRRSS